MKGSVINFIYLLGYTVHVCVTAGFGLPFMRV
jgi:hypothetical protein